MFSHLLFYCLEVILTTCHYSDTFLGAYAVRIVEQKQRGFWDVREAVEYECKASARTIQQIDAQESIPWADEVYLDPQRDATQNTKSNNRQ